MLSMIWGMVGATCLACGADAPAPTQPGRLQPPVHVNQQVSEGCSRFALRVVNGAPVVEALYNTTGCPTDQLKLETDSAPVFDAATGRLRVPLVIRNTGSVAVVAPARIRFVADSAQFLNGQGQVIPGLPDIVAVNYDTANANGRVGQWRYDTLLAASGTPQVLAPGAVSRRRWLEFAGTSWSQIVRIKLPTVGTVVGSVPPVAPDTLPRGFSDSPNLTQDEQGGPQYVRNHISVYFVAGAAQSLRQAAIAAVNGVVIGGVRLAHGDGFYVIRLPADTSSATIDAALALLSQRVEVRQASRYYKLPVKPSHLRPHDGPGFARIDWKVSDSLAWTPSQPRDRWALEGVRAPLAWGCSIGDSLTRVAVLDQGFFTTSISDLAKNVVAAPIVNVVADPEDHGTSVASIIAARGNDSVGIAGVAWRAALDLRDVTNRDSLLQPVLDTLGQRTNKDLVPFLQDVQAVLRGGARLINLSIGADADTIWRRNASGLLAAASLNSQMKLAIETALNAPGQADPLLVISSGNVPAGDGFESVFPSLKDSLANRVLVVAAARRDGTLLSARSGSALIDVAAPGVDVALLKRGGNTPHFDAGASFATPIVTGIATLLLSFDPRLSADTLRQLIIQGAVNGGRRAGGYPIVDAYESLKLAAQRPGAPLCGNPFATVATYDSSASLTTMAVDVRRGAGGGSVERITSFSVSGLDAVPVYVPHGGKEVLADLQDGQGVRRVAQHTGTTWQTLSSPWQIVSAPSLSGTSWSSRGWSHDGDTAIWVSSSYNPGFLSIAASVALWSNGTLGAPIASFASLNDRWTNPTTGIGPYGGGAGVGAALSPTGDFAVIVSTDGNAVGRYTFSRVALPSGNQINLFVDSIPQLPLFPPTFGGQSLLLQMGIAEDGSELWYSAPQQWVGNTGCVLKRYSLSTGAFLSVDLLPGNGSVLGCTGGTGAAPSGAARVVTGSPVAR